ncbi:TPA: hypothetical protein ACMDTM_003336 [Vibrio cholerae]
MASKDAAKLAAKKFAEKLKQRRIARNERFNLDYNRLFDENGYVRGMSFREKNGRSLLVAQATQNGKQKKNTRTLHNRTLYQAFMELSEWIMQIKDIEPTLEIKIDLKKSYRMLRNIQSNKIVKMSE